MGVYYISGMDKPFPIANEPNLTVVLTFRVPLGVKQIFDRICEENDITMSTFIRDALKAHAKMYLQRKSKTIDRDAARADPPVDSSKTPRARARAHARAKQTKSA